VPGFSGVNSYLSLKKIDHAFRQITIEMTFKALSNEGILFYSGKSMNGSGDFVSISIKDGYVEFR
jgi:coxsackievirus/adenovirus receptor